MEIGITGASGFIGNLLVKKHLKLGDKVHVLSRKNESNIKGVRFHSGNLLDIKSLDSFVENIDVLYHCAAEIKDESKMQSVNVEGTKNLISKSSGKIRHWVQLSSVGVYGPIYSGVVTEDYPYNPMNEYERTKLESDLLVLEASKNNIFTTSIIRPSNVFGSDMRNTSLFELIKSIDKGYYFFIGNKGASANYVTVDNVVEALYLAAINPNAINQIYNISSWCTIEDYIGIIAEQLKKPAPKLRIPIKPITFIAKITSIIPKNPLTLSRLNALTNRSVYSIKKIENELNYIPVKTIEQGIADIIKQYKTLN
ncbi:MAG: NAD-dependent epimerase/dehydratase family protein [Flavobacteriaceae bacterium]|nr:NAD-dependent epimerase/dehydratase family protein [Flavobacteriaceae bacterium]